MFIQNSSKASLNPLCIKVFDGNCYYFILFYPICLNSVSPSPSPTDTSLLHPFLSWLFFPHLLCVPPHTHTPPQVTSSRAAQQQQSQTGAGSGKNSPLRLVHSLLRLSSQWCTFCIINWSGTAWHAADTQRWHLETLTDMHENWNKNLGTSRMFSEPAACIIFSHVVLLKW